MRLAWFTPLPPTRSGIADYSLELLPLLAGDHEIDVFVASAAEREHAGGEDVPSRVHDAHDFVWRRQTAPYDLVVFHVGNASCHDYMWPYLFRYPGLVVLHDASLHHARALSLLRRERRDDYRAELAFNHPSLPPSAAEIALGGFGGALYYFWPMRRAVLQSARMVAVHNTRLAGELRGEERDTPVAVVRMGVPAPMAAPDDGRGLRARYAPDPATVLLAAFGAVTEEKRIGAILRTLSRLRREGANVRLLLVGQTMPHYDVDAEARALGVADALSVAGFTDRAMLDAHIRVADVALCLRWPSARETSASWLRAIAAGRATVVTDLAQQVDIPTLDPRTWTVQHASTTLAVPTPVAVGIDLLDEDHSLLLALRRLTRDAELRRSLGAAAEAHWAANHTLDHMAADYLALIREAARQPAPSRPLPAHLRPDPLAHARSLLAPFGLQDERLF